MFFQLHTPARGLPLRLPLDGPVPSAGGSRGAGGRPERAWLHSAPPGGAAGALTNRQPPPGEQCITQHGLKRKSTKLP